MEITASAMLTHNDPEEARFALRARLRDVVERRSIPEAALRGARMQVAGPTVVTDAAGHRWFEWVARLRIRPAVPRRTY